MSNKNLQEQFIQINIDIKNTLYKLHDLCDSFSKKSSKVKKRDIKHGKEIARNIEYILIINNVIKIDEAKYSDEN